MNANDLIEAYVTEVAERLPRRQRNDVAFELRELLNEELQAKAEETGRGIDVALATELLQAFGQPSEVAARYRPTLTIVDPADGRGFLRTTVIGLAILWSLGLLEALKQPIDSGWDLLSVLGRWWGGTVIPSLWWPGLLVVGFGAAAWGRRRWPQASEWKPRAADRIHGGRTGLVMGLVGVLCGVFVLIDPRWLLDVLWGGRAAPAAYDALTYTETFRHGQAPWLLVLLLLNVPLFLAVIVSGRWSALLRRLETALALATCVVMTWTAVDGPVLSTSAGDRVARSCLLLIVAITVGSLAIRLYRGVRPAPDRGLRGEA